MRLAQVIACPLWAALVVSCGETPTQQTQGASAPVVAAERPASEAGSSKRSAAPSAGSGVQSVRTEHEIQRREGMVFVPSGRVKLGPPRAQFKAGGPLPGGRPVAPGAPRLQQPSSGGAPPPVVPHRAAKAGGAGAPAPWRFFGGQGLESRRVDVVAFWLDQTEVTRAAYKEFLDATGYRPPHVAESWADDGYNWTGTVFPEGTGGHPVVLTNWYDATAYCQWRGKRLPREAEWQLAALGPADASTTYPWGNEYDGARLNHGRMEQPNFDDSDGFLLTAPVSTFPQGASWVGADDLYGNAWEFTADARIERWDDAEFAEQGKVLANYRASGPSLYVAVRGGSYFFDASEHPAGERNQFLPELRRKTSGFRCARDVE